MVNIKEIKIILRLFLVIAMYCQGSSSQIKSITQPPALLAGWEGSLDSNSLETTYILPIKTRETQDRNIFKTLVKKWIWDEVPSY